MKQLNLRNLAIIAHVDHGKTTLVDKMLIQSGKIKSHSNLGERIMDTNPLEKERGITILSKNTSIIYKTTRINIVDTPGHADFGGEVERILNMVDGVLLLVDAFEGPMPQTKFVLRKALLHNLNPIVVLNKIDRPDARTDEVLNQVFDLFVELGANERQLEFPHIYASAKEGIAKNQLTDPSESLIPLFELIVGHVPPPDADTDGPFQMLITDIHYDNYIGRLLIGRINRGQIALTDRLVRIDPAKKNYPCKISTLFCFEGLSRKEIKSAQAGEIVMLAGIDNANIGETICSESKIDPLPAINIEAPTISMHFLVNDSPFSGNDGRFLTSRHIQDRLFRETLSNIALKVELTASPDEFIVSGRGELHLGILIETMRREGYEFSVSRPKVIMKMQDNQKLEPIEELNMELPSTLLGPILEELGKRKADVTQIESISETSTQVKATIPTRGLISFRSLFLTLSKGEGIYSHSLIGYHPFRGESRTRSHGVMMAKNKGTAIPYAIWKLQERGTFIIPPLTEVYEGMIVAANARETDMIVNVCATKKLTNVRSSGKDDAIQITPHMALTLEKALEFIDDDELVEITPKNIRLRKKHLKEHERLQAKKRVSVDLETKT